MSGLICHGAAAPAPESGQPSGAVRFQPECVSALDRNACPDSPGISVRFGPECAAAVVWNLPLQGDSGGPTPISYAAPPSPSLAGSVPAFVPHSHPRSGPCGPRRRRGGDASGVATLGQAPPSVPRSARPERIGRCWPAAARRMPPWGVPVIVRRSRPSSVRIPAFRNAFTRARTRLSPIRRLTRSIRAECEISSKHALMSASNTHS